MNKNIERTLNKCYVDITGQGSTFKNECFDIKNSPEHNNEDGDSVENSSITKTSVYISQGLRSPFINEGKDSNEKDTEAKGGLPKRKKRVYVRDICVFCNRKILKFCRHLITNHGSEPQVQLLKNMKPGSVKRRRLIGWLRRKGNFSSGSKTAIRMARRPPNQSLSKVNILPCVYCNGFYMKKTVSKHMRICPFRPKTSKKMNLLSDAQTMLAFQGIDSKFIQNLQLKDGMLDMRCDKISFIAKSEPLILSFGPYFFKHLKKPSSSMERTKNKLRELAKLWTELKERVVETRFYDALKPENFQHLVDCAVKISGFNPITKKFKSRTLGLEMGTTLRHFCDHALEETERRNGVFTGHIDVFKKERDLEELKVMIEDSWRKEILEKCGLTENSNKEAENDDLERTKSTEKINNKSETKIKNPKIRWTREQRETTKKYFEEHLRKRKPPRFPEIEIFQSKFPFMCTKTKEQIKTFVYNTYRLEKSDKNTETQPEKPESNQKEISLEMKENPNESFEVPSIVEEKFPDKPKLNNKRIKLMKIPSKELIKIGTGPPPEELQKILRINSNKNQCKVLIKVGQGPPPGILLRKISTKNTVKISNEEPRIDENLNKVLKKTVDAESTHVELPKTLTPKKPKEIPETKLFKTISKIDVKCVNKNSEKNSLVEKNDFKAGKRKIVKWTKEQKETTKKYFEEHIKNKKPPRISEIDIFQSKFPFMCNKTKEQIKAFVYNTYRKAEKSIENILIQPQKNKNIEMDLQKNILPKNNPTISSEKLIKLDSKKPHEDPQKNIFLDEKSKTIGEKPDRNIDDNSNKVSEITVEPESLPEKHQENISTKNVIKRNSIDSSEVGRKMDAGSPHGEPQITSTPQKTSEDEFSKTYSSDFVNWVLENPVEIFLREENQQNNFEEKTKVKYPKIRWTEEQKNATKKYFKKHIKIKKAPTETEIELFKSQFTFMENKTWKQIKVFVYNTYTTSGTEGNIKKIRWTEEQKKTTKEYFKNNIDIKKPPTESEVEFFKSKFSLMENKTWQQIKVFVYNTYKNI